MKKILILLFFITTTVFAQGNYKLVTNIEVEGAGFFTTDNQSNVYIVKGDELIKFDKTGKQLYKYSNKNLGDISFIDASNMLKILVFYKEFSQIVFLDNTLSLSGEPVAFDKLGFQQALLACSSNNSNIWIYDQQNFSLVQLSQSYEKLQQTANLNTVLNMDLQPDYLLEYDNKVYLNNPGSGILVFDVYGTYYKTIPVKNTKRFQPIGDWVYYMDGKTARAYNLKTTEEHQFDMPVSDFINFRLEMGLLMIQTDKGVSIYAAEH
ncbi:MAG: hypothetical protein JWP12_3717 [Bacteroidetes bacterium]|nr:hypothetical protein [Bacteroidota bacterium]